MQMRRPSTLALATGCVIASAAQAAGTAADVLPWARFDDRVSLATAQAIVASEVAGDATLSSLGLDGDGLLVVNGRLGLDNGSRWSTLGVEIAPAVVGPDADLTHADVLRIRLASATARPLRVRIKGGDRAIANAGCYPVVVQMVTPAAADYAIPLSAFRSPGWCGTKAVTIEQTLRSVERVEVTANDAPDGPVIFSVGRIDFVAEGRSEPDKSPPRSASDMAAVVAAPAPPAVSASAGRAPASPQAVARRRPAAAGPANPASAATPSRRVVCEHSARYELMLCY